MRNVQVLGKLFVILQLGYIHVYAYIYIYIFVYLFIYVYLCLFFLEKMH